MNRTKRLWVLPLLAAPMLGHWSPSRAQTPPAGLPLDEIMANLAKAPERRASFVEDKRIAALSAPLHSQGQLAYRKPDHLEKITTAPNHESLIVDGDKLTVGDGSKDPPKVISISSQPEIGTLIATIRGAVSGDLNLLRRYYDVTGTGKVDSWVITLHPRDGNVAKLVKEVQLAGGAELQAIQSVFPNGDSDTLTITPLP